MIGTRNPGGTPGDAVPPGRVYERSFPIRLQHVDAAGIVFFARYFELAHEVYETFLEEVGHSIAAAIAKGDVIIPIASAEARYWRPMRHGETITARIRILELRGSSFRLRTEFSGPAEDLRATIETGHVCVNQKTLRPTGLPAELKEALAPYVGGA